MVKNYLLYILLIILSCNFITRNSYAINNENNDKKAKDFFDKEFVTQKQKKQNEGFVEFDENNESPTPTPTLDVKMFPQDKKVLYISLVVNGDDLESYNKAREFTENFTLDRKIQFKQMIIICKNCDRIKIENELNYFINWILGRSVSFEYVLPKKYQSITKSPTFIVGIEKGEIILEGINLLEKYVSDRGYYLGKTDYENNTLPKTPTITPTLTQTPTKTPTPSTNEDDNAISNFGF